MNSHPHRRWHILLAEDSPTDAILVAGVLKSSPVHIELRVTTDGQEMIDFLTRQGRHANGVPRPDLVLLDLDLPLRHGMDVLTVTRADPDLVALPVVILTSSSRQEDVRRCYRLHANCYVTKQTAPPMTSRN